MIVKKRHRLPMVMSQAEWDFREMLDSYGISYKCDLQWMRELRDVLAVMRMSAIRINTDFCKN